MVQNRLNVKVTFTDAGLYGVFIGEMLGQFSDGHWENSVYHQNDWKLYREDSVTLSDVTPAELPKIRYNMSGFFAYVKQTDITCIIERVLMIYDHADLIAKAYKEDGKEAADKLVTLLGSADSIKGTIKHYGITTADELFTQNTWFQKDSFIRYFGSLEKFLKEIPDPHDKKNIARFRRIGTLLDRQFNHVKSFYELLH